MASDEQSQPNTLWLEPILLKGALIQISVKLILASMKYEALSRKITTTTQ